MSLLSFIIEARDKASEVIGKVSKSFESMRDMMTGIKGAIAGALSVTAITSFAKSVLEYTGQIKDASEATGISTERFQALSIAARMNGVGMDQLSGSIARIRNLQGSIGSDKGIQDTFGKIGMSIADVQNADSEGLLLGIARGIKETGDASVAFDVFGRSAAGLLTTLNELADGWDPLVAKMKSGIISDADIQRMDELGDILDNTLVKTKSWGATAAGVWADLAAIAGRMSAGEGLWEAGGNNAQSHIDEKKNRDAELKAREDARKASERLAAEDREKKDLGVAQKEGQGLGEQFAKSNMSDKDYAARLDEKSIALAAAANEEGLTALDRQTRMNEALKVEIELRTLQKKIKEDDSRKTEEANRKTEEAKRKTEAADKSLKDAEKGRDRYLELKKSPEEQLKDFEAKIAKTKPLLASEKDPEKKADLLKEQTSNAEERDRLKKEIDDKKKARADKEESLMVQDRELRESAMSPAQRMAESKKRQADIEKQLAAEKDPDKKLDLRGALMNEMKNQTSIEKDSKTGRKSLSWGDVAERGYGQSGKKDPAREQVERLHNIEELLKRIAGFGPGGMTK